MITPGPWARCVRSPKSVIGNLNAGQVPVKVAHVTNEDDRCLISAAPDLLNELYAMVLAFENYQRTPAQESCIRSARAAIKKAKGEA